MAVLDEHVQRTNRQISIAYLLIKDLNDTPAHAEQLIGLLKERGPWAYLYHVNVIRYHAAQGVQADFSTPDEETVRRFVRQLREAHLNVTRRPSFGLEIDAACGQLYGRQSTG